MRRGILCLSVLAFWGCKDKDTGETTETGETAHTGETGEPAPTQEELYAQWVNVTETYVGDLSCYDGSSWVSETVDPACESNRDDGQAIVEEFASGDPTPNATVSFFHADTVAGSPDLTATTDADGLFTPNVPLCQAMTYQVSDGGAEYHDTYEYHVFYDAGDGELSLISVSNDTWLTLPSVFGVVIDETQGVLAGTVRDCNGDEVENAQVLLRDADGNIPASMDIGFTFNGIPSRSATATTADGVWIAMNVPPGDYTAEIYVADGAGGQMLVGKAPAQAFASSVSIVVLYTGREDGLDVPSACLDCSGG